MTDLNLAYETVRAFMATRSDPGATTRSGAARPGGTRGRRAADTGPGTTFEEREARRAAFYRRTGEPIYEHDPAGSAAGNDPRAGDPSAAARAYTERPFGPTLSPQFSRLFDKPWQFVIDGVYLFYQYGLENVHMRHQGVHRFRYRQAVKNIKDGIAGLEPLDEDTVTEADTERLTAARGFSKAFLQNMLIEKYYIPSRAATELKAYTHYSNGSRYLDKAIKRRFCRELHEPNELPAGNGMLEVVQHELITVIAKYTDSTWVPESMIKMHLLDRFTAVVEAELSA
jgi:hypothetical protein